MHVYMWLNKTDGEVTCTSLSGDEKDTEATDFEFSRSSKANHLGDKQCMCITTLCGTVLRVCVWVHTCM